MNDDDNDIVDDRINSEPYGDSDFLAQRDLAIGDFRASEKESKQKIIEKMLELRHNKKYNKHLLSVYMKAKTLFDTMVEEHRAQLHYLEEIYRHIQNIIRENLSRATFPKQQNRAVIAELMKDKKRIGRLLKKMRTSYEKLSNVDTTIGVTIEKMDEIIGLDDIQRDAPDDSSDDDETEISGDDASDDDDEDEAEDDAGDNTSHDEDEDEDDDEDEDEDEDDASDEDEDEDEDEDDDEASHNTSHDDDDEHDDGIIAIY